ncbi:MAG: LPS export ABC transporter periplasmic protein LptC [Treponema sp.]|nr:LPS export ABC transporter periplasmic protein LptC [Treponema sp.]
MSLNRSRRRFFLSFALCSLLSALSCSFNYDISPDEDTSQPDIVMRDVEYVRIRGGDPVVRFKAESAERYEDRQTMNLRNFSFDQFENHGDEINASGSARDAAVELDSGNIRLNGGVRIAVDSEDITIETAGLEWRDKEKFLSAEPEAPVEISRSDGTRFTGIGFSADIRSRTWEFTGGAGGSYTDTGDEDEEEEEGVEREEAGEESEEREEVGEEGAE